MNIPQAIELAADPRSPYLRLPTLLCAVAFGVAAATALASLTLGAREVARHCVPAIAVPLIVLAVVRRVASVTRLTISSSCIAYRSAASAWSVAWPDVAQIALRSPLAPTHRGGIAAGARLIRADGTAVDIPDILTVRRHALATLLAQHRPPSQGQNG